MYWKRLKKGDKIISNHLMRDITPGKSYEFIYAIHSDIIIVKNDINEYCSYYTNKFRIPNETMCRIIGVV